jgi:hypothetical protein
MCSGDVRRSRLASVIRPKAALLTAAVALFAGASVGAASATTTPSSTLLVEVVISAKGGVVVGKYASSATHDGLIPLGGPIPRGDFLNFHIFNRGRLPLAFSVFGRKASLKPGASGHFNVLAVTRGTFAYRVTFAGGKSVHGSMIVA